MLKRCYAIKGNYNFKNRLHLRAHLAQQELHGIQSHWVDDCYINFVDDDKSLTPNDLDASNLTDYNR